jgi:hypothetical protein
MKTKNIQKLIYLFFAGLISIAFVGCENESFTNSGATLAESRHGASGDLPRAALTGNANFEVWVVDQANSPDKDYGGFIHIFEGPQLMGSSAEKADPVDVIDLSLETTALCQEQTGSNPVRPHMLEFNSTGSHGVLAFVASGHVVIFDSETREPVSCIISSVGFNGNQQAHAAFPSADDTYILIANQNGKLLERIDADYSTNSFELNPEATLSLYEGVTPNDVPVEDPELRPDNAPICPILDKENDLGFVTLRGGGLFVVKANETPMEIVAEYTNDVIKGNGCGGLESGDSMFMNSGGGTAQNLFTFEVYRFPLAGYSPENPPNYPEVELIFADNSEDRDSHGMVLTNHERYLWVFDRGSSLAEIFDTSTGSHVNTMYLDQNAEGRLTPDLASLSPAGNRIFVSLRGPEALTGDPHVATGSAPGIGIINVQQGGRSGTLHSVVPISNIGTDGVERADAHGINIRMW